MRHGGKMAILTQSGRAALAQAMKNQTMHVAWGTGDAAWDTESVPEDSLQETLLHEVGRRAVNEVFFCVPDEQGELEAANGRFSLSTTPTRNLFIKVRYDFSDASGHTIRELGLFINSETDEELPPGQEYFLPSQVTDPGILLLLEHVSAMIRTPAVRESFSFVVSF
jgi:hypothetical protein